MRRVALGVDPVEPYSKVIKADGFIHIKSHVGLDFDTEEIVEGIGDQTRVTLDWLRKAVKAGYCREIIARQPEFTSLHGSADFRALVGTR